MTENLNQTIIQLVQKELSDYRPKQLTTVLNLLNEGNTVPFIARYRISLRTYLKNDCIDTFLLQRIQVVNQGLF